MDFSSLSPKDEPRFLHLRHPSTDEPLYRDDESKEGPVGLLLYGEDSPVYERAKQAGADEQLERVTIKRGKIKRVGEADPLVGARLVARCVAGFQNIVEDGVELQFSETEALRFLSAYRWALEQADEFITDRANFLGE